MSACPWCDDTAPKDAPLCRAHSDDAHDWFDAQDARAEL